MLAEDTLASGGGAGEMGVSPAPMAGCSGGMTVATGEGG